MIAAAGPSKSGGSSKSPARVICDTQSAFQVNLETMAQQISSLSVVDAGVGRWPAVKSNTKLSPTAPAVGAYITLKDLDNDHHTVILEVADPDKKSNEQWAYWCGNEWLRGDANKQKRLDEFTSAYSDKMPGAVSAIANDMGKRHGTVKGDTTCTFLRGSADFKEFECMHVAHAAHLLRESSPHLDPLWKKVGGSGLSHLLTTLQQYWRGDRDALEGKRPDVPNLDDLSTLTAAPAVPASVRSGVSYGKDRVDAIRTAEIEIRKTGGRLANQVLDLTSYFNGTPMPAQINGPGGWGKTFVARDLGRNKALFDYFAEIPITPGTEARDLVGGIYPVVDPDTKEKHFVGVPGPLTQAMMSAKKGRTLLLLDEVGNLDARGWNMMKNLLNPSNGEYTLATDSPVKKDGEWTLEKHSVSTRDLVILMTANIGEGYDSVLGDPAVRSRIVPLTFGPTAETVRLARKEKSSEAKATLDESKAFLMNVTQKSLLARGFSPSNLTRFGKVFDAAVDFVADQQLHQLPSPRNFARAIEAAKDEKDLGVQLAYQSQNWARLRNDFYPVAEQAKTAIKVVESAFGKVP